MFVIHEIILNEIKLKNNAKPTYKISSFFIWYWFFPKDITMHILLNKGKKYFLN
jgi:hypothetical protein